jgi:diadenosine tetraphosphate (Ap4A) HIT family hydrolase
MIMMRRMWPEQTTAVRGRCLRRARSRVSSAAYVDRAREVIRVSRAFVFAFTFTSIRRRSIRTRRLLGRKISAGAGDLRGSSSARGFPLPTVMNGVSRHREKRCLFCVQDDPAVNRIFLQNKTFYVRHDNFPATEGHVEVVPKRHVESFFDLTTREIKDAYALIGRAREELIRTTKLPDGFTIGVNEGRAAGRTVDHLHIHVIPRRQGDVADPCGGIRQVVPNCNADVWTRTPYSVEATFVTSSAR